MNMYINGYTMGLEPTNLMRIKWDTQGGSAFIIFTAMKKHKSRQVVAYIYIYIHILVILMMMMMMMDDDDDG